MKEIKDYPGYFVDENGNVYSTKFGRTKKLKQGLSHNGYAQVSLCKNSKRKTYRVHRLIWEAFNNTALGEKTLDHISGDKLDNRLYNLRPCTIGENKRFQNKKRNNKNGASNIFKTKWGSYRVIICRTAYGSYKTLEEAIKVRDSLI